MTIQTLISDLRSKEKFTALENQICKLSTDELELYVRARNKGMDGEQALNFVLNSSLMNTI